MSKKLSLKVKPLKENVTLPEYSSDEAIGLDVFLLEEKCFFAHETVTVSLGFSLECPKGHYIRIADKSSIATEFGLFVVAGVIDPDYRGEIKALLHNSSRYDIHVEKGRAIAQIIPERASRVTVEKVETLTKTKRGSKGFGKCSEQKQKQREPSARSKTSEKAKKNSRLVSKTEKNSKKKETKT